MRWALAPEAGIDALSPETSGEFVTLARIVRTQGRHGELAAEVHSDIPDRFATGMKLLALDKSDARRQLEIEDLWPHKGMLVLKFAGVDTMNDAEALVGAELQVPSSQRAQLEAGWTFVSDLVGCLVLDHGREIGRVEDVQFGAGEAPLLVIVGEEGKFDLPFAEAYLERVDAAQRLIRLNLPEGMLEINAPMTPDEKRQQQKDGQGPGRKSGRKKPGSKA